jgi:excisionase family DNA binding protein
VDESETTRATVEEAARLLGIEKGSVKKRIQRGKIRSEKDANGITWVYVDRSETVRDESEIRSETNRDELVAELRRTNELLREVITTRDEEIRRRDVIIRQLTERIPAIEAPSEAARESPETVEEAPDRAEPHPATGEAQGGVQRPWWRRVFGG